MKAKSSSGKFFLATMLLLLFGMLAKQVSAQCGQLLNGSFRVEEEYKKGNFEGILNFTECFDEFYEAYHSKTNQRLEIIAKVKGFMHYYILVLIQTDRQFAAANRFGQFLSCFPDFEIDWQLDPPQLVELMDSFAVYDARQFSVIGGPNFSIPYAPDIALLRYDIGTGEDAPFGPEFKSKFGYSIGFEWQKFIDLRHSIVFSPMITRQVYDVQYDSDERLKPSQNEGEWSINLREKLNFLQLPIQYQYRIPIQKSWLRLPNYLTFNSGVFARFLIASEAEIHTGIWSNVNGTPEFVKETRNTAKPTARRYTSSYGFNVGIGWQFELSRFVCNFRLQGDLGLRQMRRSNTEYGETFLDEHWNFQVSDQNFWLHNINLVASIGLPNGKRIKDLRKK